MPSPKRHSKVRVTKAEIFTRVPTVGKSTLGPGAYHPGYCARKIRAVPGTDASAQQQIIGHTAGMSGPSEPEGAGDPT